MVSLQKYLGWIIVGIVLLFVACEKKSDEHLGLPASLFFIEHSLPDYRSRILVHLSAEIATIHQLSVGALGMKLVNNIQVKPEPKLHND